jgi:phosphoribosylglycinamide formyltransferase 1
MIGRMKESRIAVFLSGSGTNAEKILSYFKDHSSIRVMLVLSNKADAAGISRARRFNREVRVFDREQFYETGEVLQWLRDAGITHIVLAGFLWLLPKQLIQEYPHRILNIHPALLPKFGGKGMYGMRVHEAVKAAGEEQTGITVHEVDEQYDEGKIIFQASCPVYENDTPRQIADRVQQLEHLYYPQVIEKWVTDIG